MRAIFAITGLALIGLAACAPRPAVAPASLAAPLPLAGEDWHFHADGDSAMLAFGVETSDALRIKFDCQAGSGRTSLLQPAARPANEIRLESGGVTGSWRATTEPSNLDNEVLLLAEAPVTAPVFTRFRELGWLTLDDGGERVGLAARSGSAEQIERYFKRCE